MWEETERSPALAAPGSNDFTGLIASTTVQTSGANARKVQALSEEDASDLCERYQRLAYKIAGQYINRGVELDELRSAGLFGLVEASKRFDPTFGREFGALAQYYIRGRVLECFKPKSDASGRGRASSLNVPVFTKEDEDGNPHLELITDEHPPIATVDVSDLNERERQIFEARLQGETLDSLGRNLGISRERVRQINERAVQKVRSKEDKKNLLASETHLSA